MSVRRSFAVLAVVICCQFCGTWAQGLTKFTSWKNGFAGVLESSASQDMADGWNVVVNFAQQIHGLKVWDADIVTVSDDGRHYVFANKPTDAATVAANQKLGLFIKGNTDAGGFPHVTSLDLIPASTA